MINSIKFIFKILIWLNLLIKKLLNWVILLKKIFCNFMFFMRNLIAYNDKLENDKL